MPDSIETAITSSIAGLSGSESSSSGDSGETTVEAAVPDTGAADTASSDAAVGGGDGGTPVVASGDGAAATATPAATAHDVVAEAAPTAATETLETLTAELAGKRDNRIPYSRVTKIVENQVQKAVSEERAKYAQYETLEFRNGVAAMRVADEAPERFLAALAQADPRYADLLTGAKVLGGQPAAQRTQSAANTAADVEPDIQLSDGTLGYSAEATRKLLASERARVEDAVLSKFEERLKGLAPIEQQHRVNVLRQEAAERVSHQIAAAESWPGFTDAKADIAAAIVAATKQGKQLSLHEAYIQTVIPRFRTDEATVRARILAEMKKAPAASSGSPVAAAAKTAAVESGVDPVEAAIKASISGLRK